MTEPAPADPAVLQRKMERERRARLEAEAIAEKTTLALYKLAESRDLILRSTGDGILSLDARGRVVLVNPAGRQLLSQDEADAAGKDVHPILHPPRAGARACAPDGCALLRALRDGATLADVEDVIWAPDGRQTPVSLSLTPIIQADMATGFVLTLRDTTVRKQAEEARLKMMSQVEELKRLQELDGLKTHFINMAAHELRTPLTPIRTELYILKKTSGELPEDQRRSVEILNRNFERLARLVEDILEGARLQAGRLGMRKDPINLATSVTEVVESYKNVMQQREIRLESHVDPNIPVYGDAARLSQVLINLLSNAAKCTPRGGTVTLDAKSSNGLATIRVRDTGVGLSRDDITKLFRPFSQAGDHEKVQVDGTGLGLFICKGIVEVHGGRIWVDSGGPGLGSTFSFAIPEATSSAPVGAVTEAAP